MNIEPIEKFLQPSFKAGSNPQRDEHPPPEPYDAGREYARVLREKETSATRCPPRHLNTVGRCNGSDWRKVSQKLTQELGTGFIYILIGPRGTGKTQLGVGTIIKRVEKTIAEWLADPYTETKKPACLSGRYVEAFDLFLDLKSVYASKNRTEKQVVSEYVAPAVLVLDEFTVRGETKWEDNLLTSILNKRYTAMRDTILIGNCESSEVAGHLGASVVSRVSETGGIIECKWPSFRNKVEQNIS